MQTQNTPQAEDGTNATNGTNDSRQSHESHQSHHSDDSHSQPPPWNWAREDGTFTDGWLERLPETLRGNASLKVVGSLQDLAKSYVETKSMIGRRLEMPGDGAPPEQVAAWRKTVGAPEKPEGYAGNAGSLRPDSIPHEMWDAGNEKKFLELAHRHHLPAAAVKDIIGFYGASIAEGLGRAQQVEAAVLAAEGAKLRSAWGGEHDANMAIAARTARTVGLDPATHPIFTSAEGVQIFARLGRLLSEDRLVKGDAGGMSGSMAARASEVTDPKSQSRVAREYRGEFGAERQAAAQQQLHDLLSAQAHH